MPDNSYNGYDSSVSNSGSVENPTENGLTYNDSTLEDINRVEEYSIDTSEQNYVDGNPQKIHFDNPNWNVEPANQAWTDSFALIVAIISIALVIFGIYVILRLLRVI